MIRLFVALFGILVFSASACADTIPGWKLVNLDIDRSVASQKQVAAIVNERKDLHPSINAIRLWTNSKGLRIVRNSISELRKKYPNQKLLTFLGSGDFHQLAALLIESLPESAQPVTVVMFDNHPDWFKAPAHYHCGAWVVQALHLPWVERVILLGQNSSDIRGDQFRFAPFHELCKGRVELHPLAKESVFVPLIWASKVSGVESSRRRLLGTELRFSTLRSMGAQRMGDRLAGQLAGKNVYISIDKDVLASPEAITDWDQGKLPLKDLLTIVGKLFDSANVVGIDVCGERAPERLHGILKSIDSGRTFKRRIKNFDQANLINERANLQIINLVRSSTSINKNVHGELSK